MKNGTTSGVVKEVRAATAELARQIERESAFLRLSEGATAH
jgi:hypothetical protein